MLSTSLFFSRFVTIIVLIKAHFKQLSFWFHVWQVKFEDSSKYVLERSGGVGWCWGKDRGGSPTPYDLDKHMRNIEHSGSSSKNYVFKQELGNTHLTLFSMYTTSGGRRGSLTSTYK